MSLEALETLPICKWWFVVQQSRLRTQEEKCERYPWSPQGVQEEILSKLSPALNWTPHKFSVVYHSLCWAYMLHTTQ